MTYATTEDHYAVNNARLTRGEKLFLSDNFGTRISDKTHSGCRPLKYPHIGVYAGDGTSHSWLWFIDIFDRMGFHSISILDESDVLAGRLNEVDVLAVSGGDTIAIAKALGPDGAQKLARFIAGGGVYLGSCAGAYLVMNSSKPHLCHFNFAAVKITNLSKHLPSCHGMLHKFSQAYGCGYIFHPVREAVGLQLSGELPFRGESSLRAPLYGGPGMHISKGKGAQVLATYERFTDKTQYLVDKALAHDTLINTAAAVRAKMGKGCMYLFGPHFEHPHYPQANRLVADAVYWDLGRKPAVDPPLSLDAKPLSTADSAALILTLRRELSNSRIVATGLEMMSVRWRIGAKIYEPEKIRVFLESMWRRLKPLEKSGRMFIEAGTQKALIADARETTALLRRLKAEIDKNNDTGDIARRLFHLLHRYSMVFLELYFRAVSIKQQDRSKEPEVGSPKDFKWI